MREINARCCGGPLDGEWVTLPEGRYAIVTPAEHLAAWDLDDVIRVDEPFRTITYTVFMVRPSGWRVFFPVLALSLSEAQHATTSDASRYAERIWS